MDALPPEICSIRCGLAAVLVAALFLPVPAWSAPGVVLDGSFGASGALPGPNYMISAGVGRQIGPNLFQSFSSFNLTASESATFTGPSSVQNVLARVTGGSASSIDGTVNCSIAGANLFLLNPSGVMFGPNAHVNVTGSFAVGTPDYVKLAGGGKFNTSLGGSDNLTSAPVTAFGFLSAHPAPVQMNGTLLSVGPTLGLHVIAGDVSLDFTELDAPSGNLSIFSAAGPGEVPFDINSGGSGYASATNTSFGNVSITDGSYIDVDGAGGGNIFIHAGQLMIDNSTVSSFNYGSVKGGGISLQAQQLAIQNGGVVISSTSETGDAGDISIETGSLTVDGMQSPYATGVFNFSNTSSAGNAGSTGVIATGAVSLANGGEIESVTSGTGGGITLQADSLDVEAPVLLTGILTESISSTPETSGAISVNVTHDLTLVGGGSFESETFLAGNASPITVAAGGAAVIDQEGDIVSKTMGSGSAGNINFTAGSLSLTNLSSILSYSAPLSGPPNSGNAGSVNVQVPGSVTITNGGLIGSQTSSFGNAGSVSVQADSVTIDGENSSNFFTGISDQAGTGSIGNAGPVTVDVAHELTIVDGGTISSNTFSSGNGSNVTIHAGTLFMDGSASTNLTGISATTDTGATGNGGSLTLSVDDAATIIGGGEVSTTSFTSGNAGDLTMNVGGLLTLNSGAEVSGGAFSSGSSGSILVNAGSLLINGAGNTINRLTGISNQSNSGATGNAGPLTVNVLGSLILTNQGEISSGTRSTGNGGTVVVHAGSLEILSGPSALHLTGITSETDGTTDGFGNPTGLGGNAGSVDVIVRGALTMLGGKITTDTFCLGNAGNVTVQAGTLSINGSVNPTAITGVFSNSDGFPGSFSGGNAGTVGVSVAGDLTLAQGGKIGATTDTSGQGGDVNVLAGMLNISGLTSGITAQSVGTGNSGTVTVNGGNIGLTHGGTISSSSLFSNAGSVTVNAGNTLSMSDHSSITTQAALNGGNITISAGSLIKLLDSKITTAAGDNGGNIKITSDFVVLDNAQISANAAFGGGGNITIASNFFLNQDTQITATGNTTDGTITITAPEFNIIGGLLTLPGDLIQGDQELRERCARSLNHEFSSVIVVGRGGVETPPEELQPDFGTDSLPESRTTVR